MNVPRGYARFCAALDRLHHVSFVFLIAGLAAGCASRRPIAPPPSTTIPEPAPQESQMPPLPPETPTVRRSPPDLGQFTEEGIASWYGMPFNGRRTSDGEIYNMLEFTAAHRTLPFGAIVRVTNLNNGKQTIVRINDRGPFVANRIIDLSYAAAQAIGMIGTGTAPVRLDLAGGPDPNVGYFGVQVGAFQVQENAERLRESLAARYTMVTITPLETAGGTLYRVRVGRVASEAEARELATEIQDEEHLQVFVVRLDD